MVQPAEMQSQLNGSAPKDTSVILSVNEASVQFLAIDGSGKEVGNVVLSRDEYRDMNEGEIRKKLFGNAKPASPQDKAREDLTAGETAASRTADRLGIQESVLRQKANEGEPERRDKKEVAEKGVTATKVERETGKEIPHPPEKPHSTSVVTPNPADEINKSGFNSPNTDNNPRKTDTTAPRTITHDFQINQDPRKVGESKDGDKKNG